MGSSSRPSTAGAAASAEYKRQDVLVPGISSSHKSAAVSALAWSHNGRRLAVASEDGTVRVFAADANGARLIDRPEFEFQHSSRESEFITALAFCPRKDDTLAVVGSNVTKIMDLRAKSQSASVITDAPTKDGVSASWDHHELLLVAQRGNAFTKIDLRRRRSPRTLSTGEGDEVRDVAFIDKGQKLLISTTYGVEVRSWPAFELLTVLQGHARHLGKASGVTALATTREEECKATGRTFTRYLATGGGDALICLWDLQAAVPQAVNSLPNDRLRALSFSADQQLLAYAVADTNGYTNVEVVSVVSGERVVSIPLARATMTLAFNPRWPKLLAFAEPGLTARDTKGKDCTAIVSAVVLK